MDPKGQFVFYLLAFICFVVAAVWPTYYPERNWRLVNWVATGLALWVFVLMYTAWKSI